jgi:hypothetical protein
MVLGIFTGLYSDVSPEFPVAGYFDLEHQRLRSEKLEAWRADCLRRTAADEEIARELAAGRIGLREAAAWYRGLYRSMLESQWEMFRRIYAGGSDEERFCRVVIRLVDARLPDGSAKDALIASLERELQGHLAGGTLRLPE